ncbi:hypothetical protein VTI74DRAFT_10145 [Chaetomium olivicolor]
MESQQRCGLDRSFSPGKDLEKTSMHLPPSSPDSESSSFLSESEIPNLTSRRHRWWWISFVLMHIVLLSVYIGTLLSLRAQVSRLRKHGPQLVNYENIVLEPEYMKQLGRDQFGVAVPDGSGFLGTLNVYHELHCIKRLYQYTYPDVYPRGDTPAAEASNRQHKDHCLDFLRQSAMCHADVGVITFQWSPDSLLPVANATHHQCANWKKLAQWTKARTVDMMKPGWLIHPSEGEALLIQMVRIITIEAMRPLLEVFLATIPGMFVLCKTEV